MAPTDWTADPAPAAPAAGASVAPLSGLTDDSPDKPKVKRPEPFLSEGMRNDLEAIGYAVDPVSGARFVLNRETGEVTVTEKGVTDPVTGVTDAGEVSTVDVEVTVPPTTVDPDTGETLTTDPETGVVTATNPETGETRTVEQ